MNFIKVIENTGETLAEKRQRRIIAMAEATKFFEWEDDEILDLAILFEQIDIDALGLGLMAIELEKEIDGRDAGIESETDSADEEELWQSSQFSDEDSAGSIAGPVFSELITNCQLEGRSKSIAA